MSKDNSQQPKNKLPANKKVFDVMRPGKAPASATSRPVIIGNNPKVKEDMFVASATKPSDSSSDDKQLAVNTNNALVDQDKLAEDTSKAQETTASKEASTAPSLPEGMTGLSSADDNAVKNENDTVASAPSYDLEDASLDSVLGKLRDQGIPAEAVEDEGPEQPQTNLEPEEAKPQPEPDDLHNDHAAMSDYAAEQTEADAALPEKNAQKAFSPDEVVAATGAPTLDHAFVSHHKSHTKWWEWVLIFLLIIVLGLVALNFLLDAEVISLNRDVPHTDLFK